MGAPTPEPTTWPYTNHGLVRLSSGRVLLNGGNGSGPGAPICFDRSWLFRPWTGTWAAASDMSFHRCSHVSVALGNGDAIAAGGFAYRNEGAVVLRPRSAELYDGARGVWIRLPNMATRRELGAAGTLLRDGTVLITGGRKSNGGPPARSAREAELYSPG